jgi:membrane protease YdiL (CAAX protease family)
MFALIRKYPAISYFVLAFALSWAAVLAVILPGPIPAPPREAEQLFPYVYLAMLIGPSIAGVALTAIVSGRQGLRVFLARLRTWNVEKRWYAVALLTAPAALLFTNLVLRALSPDFVPGVLNAGGPDAPGPIRTTSVSSFLLVGLVVGLGAGFFEELGWTGFATPTLRSRYSVIRTALVIGILWGAWHFLAVLWGSSNAFGDVPAPLFMIVGLFSSLLPYRVLMTLLYERTHSLLLGVFMHASLTAWMIILQPAVSGVNSIIFNLSFSAVLWALAGMMISAGRAEAAPIERTPIRSGAFARGPHV